MTLSEAKKYHAYARECLKLAETADKPETRQKLIELSRVWMEAALSEEKHHLEIGRLKQTPSDLFRATTCYQSRGRLGNTSSVGGLAAPVRLS